MKAGRRNTSIWGIRYNIPGRYHWMLQLFLRREGLALSSIGTGRNNFNMAVTDEQLKALTAKLLRACAAMTEGGWWPSAPTDVATTSNASIFWQLGREIVAETLLGGGGGGVRTTMVEGKSK
eukprot:SAG11_NODE_229_length_11945_cov_77.865187_8_plen_122_part_00